MDSVLYDQCNVQFVQIRSGRDPNMANGILMLNDYCLLEIFKYLSLHDLANFKETYGSVGSLADIDFNRKTRGVLLFAREETIHEALQIVKQFKASVNYLTFYYKSMRQTRLSDIFTAVNGQCGEQLKKLEVCGSATGLTKEGFVLSIKVNLMYSRTFDIYPFLRIANDFNFLNVLSLSDPRLVETKIQVLARIARPKVLKLEYGCEMKINTHFECLLILCGNKNFEHIVFFCNLTPFDRKNIDQDLRRDRHFDCIDKANYLKIVEKRQASAADNCLHLTLSIGLYFASLNSIPCELLEAKKRTIKLIDRYDSSYEYHNLCKF